METLKVYSHNFELLNNLKKGRITVENQPNYEIGQIVKVVEYSYTDKRRTGRFKVMVIVNKVVCPPIVGFDDIINYELQE